MMEKNVTLKPLDVGLFGADTVVAHLDRVADLFEKSGWLHARLPALFAFLFRLPIGKL